MARRKGGLTLGSDPLRRGLRGLLQIGTVQAAMGLYNAFAVTPLNATQMVAITMTATPLLIFGQNWLEDNTAFPAIGKAPASGGQEPVPDPKPGG